MPVLRRPAVVVLLVAVLGGCAGAGSAPAAPAPPPPAPPTTAPPTSSAPGAFGLRAGDTVVIDPGHNGGNADAPDEIGRPVPDGRGGTKACNTTGAATADGTGEHAIVWAIAQRLAERLRERGLVVVLTRDSDDGVGPCVDERGTAGQRAGAAAVVSVHADGAAPDARGFHVLHADPPLNDAQRGPSRALAGDLRDALRTAGFAPADYIGEDGLDPRDDIAGLNLSTVPTAMVELANLRNAEDAALVTSPEGQQRLADALAAAL